FHIIDVPETSSMKEAPTDAKRMEFISSTKTP
ncbi:MAG: hypothetical protein ACI9NN_001023, partial [Bacteroidia bacterium]